MVAACDDALVVGGATNIILFATLEDSSALENFT